jgi:hypothetical protein
MVTSRQEQIKNKIIYRQIRNPFYFLAALCCGVLLGLAVVHYLSYLTLLGIGLLGVIFALIMLRFPELTVAAFWLVFALQTTIFSGFNPQGFFYPIYGLMVANILFRLAWRRLYVPWPVVGTYLAFLALVLFSVLHLATGTGFTTFQKLFILSFGLLVFFQFYSKRSVYPVLWAQGAAGLVVAAWVIIQSVQGGFGYRGDIGINQNYVATIVAFGVLPLFALLRSYRTLNALTRILIWSGMGVGAYATLLLASRGMSVALFLGLAIMLARVLGDTRKTVIFISFAVAIGIGLMNLPGSSHLTSRFHEQGVSSLNGRLPLWNDSLDVLTHASFSQILIGHGFEASAAVTMKMSGHYTSSHNGYLEFLLNYGLIGLGLFLTLHVLALGMAWRRRDTASLYAVGAVIFLLVADFSSTPDGFLPWLTLGQALAIGAWSHGIRARAGIKRLLKLGEK